MGASWTSVPATSSSSATPGTITAVNVTRTVPAGTFNNCVQATYGPTITGTSVFTEISYYCPGAGNYVEDTGVTVDTTNNSVSSYDDQLQAGYVAN